MKSMLLSGLCILLLISGCGWNGTPTRSPEGIIPLTSIKIVPVYSTIALGTSTTLKARGFYEGVSGDVDITDQVVWKSSDITVANFLDVPNSNRISSLNGKAGTVDVTATLGNVSATFTLTVSSAKIKTINVSSVDTSPLPNGLERQFTATGSFDDNTTQELTFDTTWSSSDTNVATVSKDTVGTVLAKAVASTGTASILARFDGVDGSASLAVTAPVLKSIEVTPANSSVDGFQKTVNFIATGTYSAGPTQDITTQVTWNSTATAIATIITSSGVATTVASGTTTISAALGGISGNTKLTVTAPALKTNGLQITPANSSIILSSGIITQQLTLTATFADNSTQIVTASAIWTIPAASSIASVGANTGLVTATSTGTGMVTIQAAYLNQTASSTVTITQ